MEASPPDPGPPHASIIAIVPAYQEADAVGRVVAGARAIVPVIVVDDGSTDDTTARAAEAGARVIVQRPNQGKGAALRAGFRAALDAGCAAAVTLDADGQHDPAEIPAFLDAFAAARPDLVVGRRDFSRMPAVRRAANVLGGLAFSWAVGLRVPDNQSGYRLVSRRLMEAMLASGESGFEFEVEMLTTCIVRGWPIAWVPIRTIYAGEASHISPGRHLREFLRIVRDTRRTVRSGRRSGAGGRGRPSS